MKFLLNLRYALLSLTLYAGIFTTHNTLHAQQKASPELDEVMLEAQRYMDELGKLSPEEQEVRILADIQKMEEDIKNMTPEQRKAFDDFMESDELMNAMQDMFQEETPQPAPVKPLQPKKEEKPSVTTQQLNKQAQAIELLSNIIKRINSFLFNVSRMTTFAGEVKTWYNERKLTLWPSPISVPTTSKEKNTQKEERFEATKDWATINGHIATLVQKLEQLQAKDAKNNYKYLDFFIEEKGLYSDLEKLSKALTSYEPSVKVPELGVGELDKKAESAIQSIINNITEAIYSRQAIPAINAVIEKYEPTAKKLREEEEATAKKALEQSKKPVRTERMQIGGSDSSPSYPSYPNYPDYNYPGYSPAYTPAAPQGPSFSSNTTPKDTTSATEGGAGAGAAAPKEETHEDKQFQERINTLARALEDVDDIINTPNYLSLKSKLSSAKDEVKSLTLRTLKTDMPTITEAAKQVKTIKNSIKRLSKKNPASQKRYEADLQSTIEPHKQTLEKVLNQVRGITTRDISTNTPNAQELDKLANALERILDQKETEPRFTPTETMLPQRSYTPTNQENMPANIPAPAATTAEPEVAKKETPKPAMVAKSTPKQAAKKATA